ncbi:MAG: hypothetical protein HZA93_22540 [Verrucomicrobia bacterium]|nr:hypothetical protein [Verrucomicrobiota bacterium]
MLLITLALVLLSRASAQIYSFSLFAGQEGRAGHADDAGSAARFSNPGSVAVDHGRAVYVADTGNHTIRRISPEGVVTTVAGSPGESGSTDGVGSAARFSGPEGVAVGPDGVIYVADSGNGTIRKISREGVVSTFAGTPRVYGHDDGVGGAARFAYRLRGLTVDKAGNIFVADRYNGTIRRISPDGVVTTLAPNFGEPTGVAIADNGDLFVTANAGLTLRKFSASSVIVPLVAASPILGSRPVVDGVALPVTGVYFDGVAVDSDGNAYVLSTGMFKYGAAGQLFPLTIAGDAENAVFRILSGPGWGSGVAVDAVGTVYHSRGLTHAIYKAVPLANPARLTNVSVLATLADGSDTVTLGAIVGGAGAVGTKSLLMRAAGPSLGAFGVTDTLADPKIESYFGSLKTGENDDWGGAATLSAVFAEVGAFPFTTSNSKDASLYAPAVSQGGNTLRVTASGAAGGIVLAEIYEATPTTALRPTTPRLTNVSVLKNVGSGLTVGFIVGGEGRETVLVRAIGPSLALFGVPGFLADPKLELFDSLPRSIGANDSWGAESVQAEADMRTAFTRAGAFGISQRFTADAALVATLTPGNYTVQVRSADGTTGVVLVEVYEVP